MIVRTQNKLLKIILIFVVREETHSDGKSIFVRKYNYYDGKICDYIAIL